MGTSGRYAMKSEQPEHAVKSRLFPVAGGCRERERYILRPPTRQFWRFR
jgi:hypothetical protein